MGIILHLVFVYGLPILCYLLAHKMPNKKWLTIYAIFWFTVLGVGIYDLRLASNLPDGDNDLSLVWAIVMGVLFWTSIAAIVGIISKAIVLYLTSTGL